MQRSCEKKVDYTIKLEESKTKIGDFRFKY